MFQGMGRWRERYESTAAQVAAEIIRILEDPNSEQITLVGDDAKELQGSTEDEMIAFLGVDWPRRS